MSGEATRIFMSTIFIDESGTLPDLKDKYIVIAGVGVKKIKEAKNIISKILASLRQRKVKVKELKFYYAGQRTKRQFLSAVVSSDFKIFALTIDKRQRKIADSPENYSLLVSYLINEIYLWQKIKKTNIIIDKHFHRKIDQNQFNLFLKKQITKALSYKVEHIDSQQNLVVNIADMAAGAILWKRTGKDPQFYDLIKDNIIIEKLIGWPDLKRKSLNKKLT